MRRAGAFGAALLLLAGLGACSSGSGNEDLVNQFAREATFDTDVDGTVLPDGQVEIRQTGSVVGGLELTVEVRNVSNLWALAFSLEFDSRVIRYDSADELGFLGSSDEVELVVAEAPGRTDRIVVGITRLADPPTPRTGRTGGGDVMVLRFSLERVGSTAVRFIPNLAGKDPDDVTVLDDDNFFGGTVTTR